MYASDTVLGQQAQDHCSFRGLQVPRGRLGLLLRDQTLGVMDVMKSVKDVRKSEQGVRMIRVGVEHQLWLRVTGNGELRGDIHLREVGKHFDVESRVKKDDVGSDDGSKTVSTKAESPG